MRAKAIPALGVAADLALAGAAAAVAGCILAVRHMRTRGQPASPVRRRLLVIDSWYSLSVLRARRAEHMITHRDLGGYFEHVWSVHPVVGADPRDPPATGVGRLTVTPLSAAHTMVEGRVRRFESLARLPYLNFTIGQIQLVLALDRLIGREGIGIIRGDPYYHGLLGLLLGRLNGRSVELRINANHDAIYEAVGALAYPRLFRWRSVETRVARFTLSRADSIVVGSADNRGFALHNGAPAERITYIGNWSMINSIHLEEPLERQVLDDEFGLGHRPVVVYVGRFERLKHPDDVVTSVAKAHRRNPEICAILVGAGRLHSELLEMSVQLGMMDSIIFAGERDQRWIARLLPRASVVAAPHAGLALVEAALSGTPIVAYDYEWHSELIRSEREGILVPYRDTDAMADAICALVENSGMAARLGAAARRRALQMMQPAELLAHERAHAGQLLALAGVPSA